MLSLPDCHNSLYYSMFLIWGVVLLFGIDILLSFQGCFTDNLRWWNKAESTANCGISKGKHSTNVTQNIMYAILYWSYLIDIAILTNSITYQHCVSQNYYRHSLDYHKLAYRSNQAVSENDIHILRDPDWSHPICGENCAIFPVRNMIFFDFMVGSDQ